MGKESYQSEWVRCGKRCGGCPHGPYWYAYWREGKKTKKRYCGKGDPRCVGPDPAEPAAEPAAEPEPAREPEPPPHRWDDIFNDRKATFALALEILGLEIGATLADAKARYRELSAELHPDRNIGEDSRPFMRAASAFAYVRKTLS